MWTKEKRKLLMRDLREITGAVERLGEGACELEAKELAMLSSSYISTEMRREAIFLTAMNNSTAEWIQSTLKKVEGIVRVDMEGAEGAKELVEEFIKVLKEAVTVLNEYKVVKETYGNELNRCPSISSLESEINLGSSKVIGGRFVSRFVLFLRRMFCSCV